MGLVPVKTYNSMIEVQVAKSKLEAHDIPAFLFDEYLGGNQFPPAVLPGFRLMVPEECVSDAVQILETEDDIPGNRSDGN